MENIRLSKWDSAEHLQSDEDMMLYLEACLEEAGDDAAFIAKALGNIARAKGMTQLAKDTGLGRESLYKALSGEGNPSFGTILKVLHALASSCNHGSSFIRDFQVQHCPRPLGRSGIWRQLSVRGVGVVLR